MEILTPDHASFERFDRSMGQGSVRDPYPGLAALRERGPLVAKGSGAWLTTTWDSALEVLRDPERFSSRGYAQTMGPVMGRTVLELDPPEHTRLRALLQAAFSRRALARWEQRVVRPALRARLAALRGRGRADLVRELTFPFPVDVIAAMIGLPEAVRADFHRLAVELISVSSDFEGARRAGSALTALFAPELAERRRRPREDLLSELARARLDGRALHDEEIFAFCRLLAPAGAETTYRSSSNLLYALLRHPRQLEALRRDRSRIPRAIEEGLRWEPPLLGILRSARRATRVGGVALPEGATLLVHLGAANRDPARWSQPDHFDPDRPARAHLAFAAGPHVCLGMHLARLETRVLLEEVLAALPGLRLDPDARDVHIRGEMFRSPAALPVHFDA